jgi:hypothetical protein
VSTAKLIGVGVLLACWVAIGFAGGSATEPRPADNSVQGRRKASSNQNEATTRRDFVGDTVCRECHQEIAESYARTAHHLTSQLPSRDSIAGKFTDGANILKTGDRDLRFRMDAKGNGFYETAIFWQPPDEKIRTERIDIVTGSGEKGQTYLYWKGNQLFQLPVSYWTELHGWINSPGFVDGVADFDRPIVPRCLECHATYFASMAAGKAKNRYKKTDFVLGISCERCHGPGHEHVHRERQKNASASAGTASSLVNPAKLPRERQMEVCAQCHGGIGRQIANAFSYVPGQRLEDYIILQRPDPDARVDVHGNQVALTQRSRCYQNSQMTCTTCHAVHAPEREAAAYSEKCLRCHQEKDCGEFARLGAKLRENCVDCHMPVQDSDLIVANLRGKQIRARMRNHWIRVYPELERKQ